MKKKITLPSIPEQEQTPLVKSLLSIIEQLVERVEKQDEENAHLKDEINILKGEKKRPVFKGGKLDKNTNQNSDKDKKPKKRAGSNKKNKTSKLTIHKDEIVKPVADIPEGSRFKGYRDFVVQDLHINVRNTRYRLEHWVTPKNKSLTASLPDELNNRHFGPQLRSYILYQHHHSHTTQPKLLEQLQEWGIDISSGQINHILLNGHTEFHSEKDAILQKGLEVSSYVTVDDSGARHQGKNGYVTHIGNEFFAWFQSTDSKSRINFLSLLRAGNDEYHLSDAALLYMKQHKLSLETFEKLSELQNQSYTRKDWLNLLDSLSISKKRHLKIATEGALLGSVLKHGLCEDLVIVSDDAGQFNILLHALCWVHTERLVHKMQPLNDKHRADIASVRGQIWDFYADLKRYKSQEEQEKYDELKQRFDEIFTQKTSFATLNSALIVSTKTK